MGKLVDRVELAEIFEKNPNTLTTWQKNGMPIRVEGGRGSTHQYDSWQCIQWWHEWQLSKLTVNDDGQVYRLDAERARLAHHQANKAALEALEVKGELVRVESAARAFEDALFTFRAAMLAIPSKLASVAMSAESMAEVREWCQTEVEQALDELSNALGNFATDSEDSTQGSGGDQTADAVEGVGVGGAIPEPESRV